MKCIKTMCFLLMSAVIQRFSDAHESAVGITLSVVDFNDGMPINGALTKKKGEKEKKKKRQLEVVGNVCACM